MHGPPDPETRKAALPSGPDRKLDVNSQLQNAEPAAQFQERSLRQRFAVGYYLASTIAPLIWGLPR